MKIGSRPSRLRTALAALGALVVSATLLTPTTASAADQAALPEIVTSVSEAGFAHPGVGLTADDLENMRTQVADGVEPWSSYYAAMSQTRYASRTFVGENAGPSDEQPRNAAYDNATMRGWALRDGIGAVTQSLLYVVTGDEVYRANALRVIRTWSSLDPQRYAYFADAHVHTGDPLYKMLIAAEILRSTTPANDSLDGYDLRWTERDQQRIEANLIRPVLDTFLFSQNRLWNQHLYGVIGMVAAAIFLDDAELYAQRVEWFTVNTTYESEHTINGGDVNGSLASIFRLVEADDPRNPYNEDFVQHMEMGRDQAHAEGDVAILTALARIVNNQGTLLDPVHGTVSQADDAVSAYEFLDKRLLAGADAFAAYMLGDEVPYVDLSGGSGRLSGAYRGRLIDALNELYHQYRYVVGVDVDRLAPHLAEVYKHRDGPLYSSGSGTANFWNERGSDFNAAEYWVAFPPELADEDVAVPPQPDSPELAVSQFGHPIGAGATPASDDDGTGFVRLDAGEGEAQLAVRRAVFPDRSTTALVGIRIRTHATTILEVASSSTGPARVRIPLPDTGGLWRYVTLDIDSRLHPVSPVGGNILFLRAGDAAAPVDVAGVLARAGGTLTPAVFADGTALSVVAVAGEEFSRTLATTGEEDATLELQDAPEGASLAADGTLRWTPRAIDTGTHRLVAVASDESTDTALPVTIVVAPDRTAAVTALLDDVEDRERYTSVSWAQLTRAHDAALEGVDGQDASAFAELLDRLRVAVAELSLLDPALADGTLDFSAILTSAELSSTTLVALTDGDNQTTWGDQRVREIVLDAGLGYRLRADAFGLLARDTFGNRGQGTNVYGSDDASTWTLLTEHPSSGDDAQLETIPVRADARATPFRFLKLQLDEPGPPTDPLYPGIWTIADLRIHGERSEVASSLSFVSIDSADASAGRVVPGDEVAVSFTGDPQTAGIEVTVLGAAASVVEEGAGSWTARAQVPGADGAAPVTFSIASVTPGGEPAALVSGTTDGSRLFRSDDTGLIDADLGSAAMVAPDGSPDTGNTANSARLFDGHAATVSDTRATDGVFSMTWDLGEGAAAALSGAELLVRQDGTGISRLVDLRLEGSNDLSEWSRLTPEEPRATLSWQRWRIDDPTAYRYIRVANGAIIGIAELRVFGDVVLDLDAMIADAQAQDLAGHSRASAVLFTRELQAVQAAREQDDADEQALARRLRDAWDLLTPPPLAVAGIDPAWVSASTPSWDGRRNAAANGWAMFDGDATTLTDTREASGWVQVVPDDDTAFVVESVRWLPRAGFESRSNGVAFQGSQDGGRTWQTFATTGSEAAAGWSELTLPAPVHVAAVRVLASSGNVNLAEVQLVSAAVDVSALELYLAETASLAEDDWTGRSWRALTDARTAASALVDDGVDATQPQVDEAAEALAASLASLEPAVPAGPRAEPPAAGVLWSDSGWAHGLADGDYTVTMSLWWGSNATRVELYENGRLVGSRDVTDDTPNAQHVAFPLSSRVDGVYDYVAVLINRNGRTETEPLRVQVTDASPGVGVLSHDNTDRDESYAVAFDLWWGTNGTVYRLYEDDVLIDTQTLTASSPGAQHVTTVISGREAGRHSYRAELENAAGTTSTEELIVEVG